jgi:hypothetical protein
MKRSSVVVAVVALGLVSLGVVAERMFSNADTVVMATDATLVGPDQETTTVMREVVQDSYEKIGQHDPGSNGKETPCDLKCGGAFERLPNTIEMTDGNLARYLDGTPVRTVAAPTRRPSRPGENRRAFLSVGAVTNNRRIALQDLVGGRAQVVAVLEVGQNSAIDARYGLGEAVARGMSKRFFIVAHDYDISDTSEPPVSSPARYSRKVAQWSLYGIRGPNSGSPTIEKLPVSGTLRWCRHRHATNNNTGWAGFTACDAEPRAASILEDSEAMSLLNAVVQRDSSMTAGLREREIGAVHLAVRAWADANAAIVKSLPPSSSAATTKLVEFARMLDDSPAWFVCGVGCCIADT